MNVSLDAERDDRGGGVPRATGPAKETHKFRIA